MSRRAFAVIGLIVAHGACGRIGYDAVGPGGAGGTVGASGTGGNSGATGTAGTTGTGGTTGIGGTTGAGGTGGSIGGTAGGGGASGVGGTGGSGGASGAAGSGGGGGAIVDGGSCAIATYGGHTYALCDGPLSWNNANTDCVARGMRLVRIDDAQENQWVLATAFAGVAASDNQSTVWRWLGGTDVAVTGEWRWTDGALFWLGASTGAVQNGLYANWLNNRPTSGGTATDCAIMQHNTEGFWTDWDCARLEPYVCEQY